MAAGSRDGATWIFDLETGEQQALAAGVRGSFVAFSPDQSLIATECNPEGGTFGICLWHLQRGELVRTLPLPSSISAARRVVFSPAGRLLAAAGNDGKIRLWGAATGQERTLLGHKGFVASVHFSPNGKLLASAGRDRTIRLWEVETGIALRTLAGHAAGVTDVAFHPFGNLLASSSHDRTVRLWDVRGGRETRVLRGHTAGVRAVSFGEGGLVLFSAAHDRLIHHSHVIVINGPSWRDHEHRKQAETASPTK